MILDVLENQECYSYPENTLEISAEDQIWDKETWIERSSQIDSDDIAAIMDELGF